MPNTIRFSPWLLSSPPARPNPWTDLVHFKEDRSRVWVYATVEGTYDPAASLLTYRLDGNTIVTKVNEHELRLIACAPNSINLSEEQAAELGERDSIFVVDLSKPCRPDSDQVPVKRAAA